MTVRDLMNTLEELLTRGDVTLDSEVVIAGDRPGYVDATYVDTVHREKPAVRIWY